MAIRVYRDDVTVDQIMFDGWSRGLSPEQTIEEAETMGFIIKRNVLLNKHSEYYKDMIEWFAEEQTKNEQDLHKEVQKGFVG